MKKILLILLSLFFIHLTGLAQSTLSIEMDKRVLKHYTSDDLKEIELKMPSKLKALNFYYSSSFIVYPSVTGATVDPSTVDVTEYEHLRQESKRVKTGLNRSGVTLELLSRDELKVKYNELENTK